jgi:hypothetical protein
MGDLMDSVIGWLLEGEPWVEYRTRIDLLKQPRKECEVVLAKEKMLNHFKIKALLAELRAWPGTVISSHKSASQSFHRLAFIADLGVQRDDSDIGEIISKVMENQSDEGPFRLPINVPKHFSGSGKDEGAWALCDAPTLVYALAKFGLKEDKLVQKAVNHLVSLSRESGWPCTVSKELGKFRGPGRKDDPCPYATLIMLKMLLQFPQWKDSREAHAGAESLLNLWQKSRETHPYMFYMGTDFRKLKAPYIWYDILHVLDTLAQFCWLKNDPRLLEMEQIVTSKADKNGKYTPESEWKAWNGWDFGQKKQPSKWLTFLVLRTFKELNDSRLTEA